LFDQIHSNGQPVTGGILLPTSLVIRDSVRDLASSKIQKDQRHVCG
jgi:hypothetical protein